MKENINVITSIKTNYLSWLVILLSVIIVSQPSIIAGFITFFSLLFFAYFVHRFSHFSRNVFTILHHYHHENNNFFSHFSQILLELSLGFTVLPYYYFLGSDYVDIWTTILFTLFYSTVHNFNYGQLRVNDVHYLHHINIFTNIGPDICDIAFNTKNCKNTEVENTNHYIPNLILITAFVLLIKHLSTDTKIKDIMIRFLIVFMSFCVLFVSVSSVYLYFTYTPDKNKDKDKDRDKEKDKEKEIALKLESTLK